MHILYDSETYSVTHLVANATIVVAPLDLNALVGGPAELVLQMPALIRDGFEIVDKHTNKKLYLDGSWAELFRKRIYDWSQKTPSQEEVEETLEQYAELAQNPVAIH